MVKKLLITASIMDESIVTTPNRRSDKELQKAGECFVGVLLYFVSFCFVLLVLLSLLLYLWGLEC